MKRNMYRLVAFLVACCVTMTVFATSVLASEEDGQDGENTGIEQDAEDDDDDDDDLELPETEEEDDDDELTDSEDDGSEDASEDDEDEDDDKDEDDESDEDAEDDEAEEKDGEEGAEGSDSEGSSEGGTGGSQSGESEIEFTYDSQPGSADDVLQLVNSIGGDLSLLPKWREAIDELWLPDGWTQELVVDEETGAEYWQLTLLFRMGAMPTDALIDLQTMIDLAEDGGTIVIPDDVELTAALTVSKSLTFEAAEGKDSVTITSASDTRHMNISSSANLTFKNVILDGNNDGGGIYIATGTVTLNDVVLQNCDSTTGPQANGGAVYVNNNGHLSVGGDSVFEGNNTPEIGGAIYLNHKTCTLTITDNVVFKGNSAGKSGGAIYSNAAPITISDNVQFLNNSCFASNGAGGAILISGGANADISSSSSPGIRFIGNESQYNAGAISISGSARASDPAMTVTVSGNVTFENNIARNQAGAIFVHKNNNVAALIVENGVVFDGNEADGSYWQVTKKGDGRGGAIFNNGETYISGNVRFTNNSASLLGGAVYNARIGDDAGSGTTVTSANTLKIEGPSVLFLNNEVTGDNVIDQTTVGGGAIAGDRQNIEIRGSVTFSNNTAPIGYYIFDPAEKTNHNNLIDPTVTFSSRFFFGYNNFDMYHMDGLTDAYDVDFDPQNGDPVIEGAGLDTYELDLPRVNPERFDYVFTGWYLEPDAQTKWIPGTAFDTSMLDPVTNTLTLYGGWYRDAEQFEVKFVDYEDNEIIYATKTVYEGDTVSKPSTPVKEGFAFDDWYTASGVVYDFGTAVTENLTLYAKFTSTTPVPGVYEVTFKANGGRFILANINDPPLESATEFKMMATEGELIVLPSNFPAILRTPIEKYKGLGWHTEDGEKWDLAQNTMIDGPLTLIYKWEEVDTGSGGGGTDKPDENGGGDGDGDNNGNSGNNGGGGSDNSRSFGGSSTRDIYPGDVPLAQEILTLIEDEGVPLATLGTLPKTGQTGMLQVASALCVAAIAAGVAVAPRKKSKKEDN